MKIRGLAVGAVLAVVALFLPLAAAQASDGGDDEGELQGVIESLPSSGLIGDWVVSGTTVHVTVDTEIDDEDGAVAVGASVEVQGTTESDGSITADQIDVQEGADDDEFGEIEFEGFVEALPPTGLVGDWTVSGTIVHVTSTTEIEQEDGSIAVGSPVEVEGLMEADGSVTASKVELKDAEDVDDTISMTGVVQRFVPTASHVGRWRVSHHVVKVRRGTAIVHAARLARGSNVRVLGTFRRNGSIRASKIVVRSH